MLFNSKFLLYVYIKVNQNKPKQISFERKSTFFFM